MLVGMWRRGIRPDLILFADVGSERQATYDYLIPLGAWLREVGFPPVTIVRYVPRDFKHWPPYHTLEENCLTNSTLPSIAYGRHSRSSKWKIAPQNRYLDTWLPAIMCWGRDMKVLKAVGFDASPREQKRAKGCSTYAIQDDETDNYDIWFPLQQWGWDLAECIRQIKDSGLEYVPDKSSCYFCTAMKPWEVDELAVKEPDKLKRIVIIEARAAQRNLNYAESKGWPEGVGVPLTKGLWRKAVKGMRGATKKPGSMTEYILEKGFLSKEEVQRLIAATPTSALDKTQVTNWQEWLKTITN